MFTVGQTLVLGLAGSIYVVGAVLLLGGPSVLRGRLSSDGRGGQIVRADILESPPAYFVPDLEGCPADPRFSAETSGPDGDWAPAGRMRTTSRAAQGKASAQKRRTSHPKPPSGSSLRVPICLN